VSYWLRELGGWALVLLGIYAFFLAYHFCLIRQIFEAWPITVFGIFLFRGGIHLLKVAIAARACGEVQQRLYPAADRLKPRPWQADKVLH
jgi:hypothetical protein